MMGRLSCATTAMRFAKVSKVVRQEEHVGFVATATIQGVEAVPVTVEVSVGQGLPGIHIVGMPDTAIQEAKQRVRQALKASHFEMRNRFVVVNLAPSSLKKIGSGFDLPIALAFLIATGQIDPQLVAGRLCVGELSLDGTVKAVSGQLAYEKLAYEKGWKLMTGPTLAGMYKQQDQEHVCLERLADLCTGDFVAPEEAPFFSSELCSDYSDIAGNELVKRALQIAAAGSHGLLMVGPPGSGKSMMASRLPSILPSLEIDKRIESALIHSVAGLPFASILEGERPFRAPHHGASRAGLIGGGNPLYPGEVSLAHNGVLFLDELPEFGTAVLQMLRQPMEQHSVSLARAGGTVTFPADFMLIAASNPCPCGFYGDPKRSCTCTPAQIARYQGRVGGPLMDRIKMTVDVWRSDPAHVLNTGKGTSSVQLKEGVMKARSFAEWRHAQDVVTEEALLASCRLGTKERSGLEIMAERYQMSGRGIMSAVAVARTIADMEESERVTQEHLFEAVSFRKTDRETVAA
jgi:magnesium chelatase family protein